MKRVLSFSIIALLALALTGEAFAQRGMGRGRRGGGSGGGWGMGTNYGRMYSPATVETLEGSILKIEKITPFKGMNYGIHIIVKTDEEEIPVHLGPGWFIENQENELKVKDKIKVTGSKITYNDKPAVIAAEIKKGDETLVLRDKGGFPVWSGWRRGRARGAFWYQNSNFGYSADPKNKYPADKVESVKSTKKTDDSKNDNK